MKSIFFVLLTNFIHFLFCFVNFFFEMIMLRYVSVYQEKCEKQTVGRNRVQA